MLAIGSLDVFVNIDPGARNAALAHVDEQTNVAGLRSLIEVGIFADDHCRLATKLERDLQHIGWTMTIRLNTDNSWSLYGS